MGFYTFVKVFVLSMAAAALAYALFPDFGPFRLFALAFGFALAFPFVYPHIRGVRAGDTLMIEGGGGMPLLILGMGSAVALEDGRRGKVIGAAAGNGRKRKGIIVSYAGFFTPAKIRLLEDTQEDAAGAGEGYEVEVM